MWMNTVAQLKPQPTAGSVNDISQHQLAPNQRAAAAAKLLQSCPTLCNLIDSSPPGSPVPGILQARKLEWVAISFSIAWKWKVKVKSLSCVWLQATPWTAAYQGSSVHAIFQARVLEWVAITFSNQHAKQPQTQEKIQLIPHRMEMSSLSWVLPKLSANKSWANKLKTNLSRVCSVIAIQPHQPDKSLWYKGSVALTGFLWKHEKWDNIPTYHICWSLPQMQPGCSLNTDHYTKS